MSLPLNSNNFIGKDASKLSTYGSCIYIIQAQYFRRLWISQICTHFMRSPISCGFNI